jgi:serine/threonine-protein kinase
MGERRISHYRLVRQLGKGGMGQVFLAQDTRLDRLVAIKLMSAELARNPNQHLRFATEAKAVSGLNHPNICTVHEVGETEDGRPFLAMEYIEGQTLETTLKDRRLKIRETIKIGIQISEALEAAHARHVLHRDIKPANIMLNQRGEVKILDFGLAKRFRADGLSASFGSSSSDTETGFSVGTPHYMSPEQALGQELDDRSDIFNVGVVLYELLTSRKPFQGKTVGETINSIINLKPEPLGLENPVFTPALDNIIFKCLEKEPAKRYASAGILAQDLARLKSETEQKRPSAAAVPVPIASADDTKLWQLAHKYQGQPVVWIAGVLALAGLCIFGAWLLLPKDGAGTASSHSQPIAASPAPPQKSVAVLPFDNFSGEPDTDYLSDGLTEEITAALSRVPGLKVAARNSAFTFRGKKEDLRKIGEALHVATLLEGSMRKVGKQIRVTAQLVNTADGFHLWSETYDRSIEDLIAVQEDIARRIAERLQADGTGSLVQRKPVDPDAYKLYLQGRQFWNKRTESALRKAAQLYQSAIEKDPTYAAAHGGLAAAYLLIPLYSFSARPSEYAPLVRAAANEALKLDPSCAEAHAVLANLQADGRHFKEAEEHFRQAISADPNYATAHHWYGRYLYCRGRMDEGLKELRTAVDLDPLSPIIHATIPAWYLINGEYDRSIEEARRVIDQFPEFAHARMIVVEARILKGEFKECLGEIDKARALIPEEPLALMDVRAYALARMGQEAEARKILSLLDARLKEGKPAEFSIAVVHLGLREYDLALDALERLNATEGLDMEILVDPFVREMRDLPRFQSLLEKAGLKSELKERKAA